MVRLDKNKIQSGLGRRSKSKDENEVKEESLKPQNTNSELEKFSLYVLKVLMDDNIPSTPNNFQIYFDKLLDNKPLSFKKRINDLLESELANGDELRAKMEKEMREGFAEIKNIMQIVSTTYKNLNVMEKIVKKRKSELDINAGQLSVANVATSFEQDLNKLSTLMEKQMSSLKVHYDKTGEIVKDIENKAIFDIRFGVYNKRYLLQSLDQEIKSINQFGHKSSLVFAKIKDSVLKNIVNTKDKMILTRNISKLLLKTSRRSDVVAHYGDGIFVMLMKHTDINNAKRACERISDLIYATSFFLGDTEVALDIELAIVSVVDGYSKEVLISDVLDALPLTGKHLEPFIVCDNIEGEEKSESAYDS